MFLGTSLAQDISDDVFGTTDYRSFSVGGLTEQIWFHQVKQIPDADGRGLKRQICVTVFAIFQAKH